MLSFFLFCASICIPRLLFFISLLVCRFWRRRPFSWRRAPWMSPCPTVRRGTKLSRYFFWLFFFYLRGVLHQNHNYSFFVLFCFALSSILCCNAPDVRMGDDFRWSWYVQLCFILKKICQVPMAEIEQIVCVLLDLYQRPKVQVNAVFRFFCFCCCWCHSTSILRI